MSNVRLMKQGSILRPPALIFNVDAFADEVRPISRDEAETLAQVVLAEKCKAPVECQFSLGQNPDGWSGLVWFSRRGESSECMYGVGGSGHTGVRVRNGRKVEIIPGA